MNFPADGKPIPTNRGLLLLAFLPTSDLGDCKDWKEVPAVVEKCDHLVWQSEPIDGMAEVRCEVCNYRYTKQTP